MICPFADFRPIPPQLYLEEQAKKFPKAYRLDKTQLILHSAAGGYQGSIDWWRNEYNWRIYSTFFILRGGEIIQLVDSSFVANANSEANEPAISVETESPEQTDAVGWTDNQLDSLTRLAKWTEQAHDIPMRPCPAHDQPGYAVHTSWGNTPASPWLGMKAKTCPGLFRIRQYFKELLPAVGYAPKPGAEAELFDRWNRMPKMPAPKAWGSARKRTHVKAKNNGKRASLDATDFLVPDRDEAVFMRRRNERV